MLNRVSRIAASALLLTFLFAWGALASGADIVREPFKVNFGGFESQGELTYPAEGEGPFPAVVLVHGSGANDMDHLIADMNYATGEMVALSTNFATIAEYLSAHGYAVLRYNKRFVNGPNDADWMRYSTEVTLQTMADDANSVLDFAKDHPVVDAERLYVYGWSEGSTIAAHLAVENPDISGLIVQTPVALPWRETMTFQMHEVGVPYLRSVLPDGVLTNDDLFPVLMGEGGMVAKGVVNYVIDPVAMQQFIIQLNTMLDFNGDGALSIDDEIVPSLGFILDSAFSDMGYFSMYAADRALPVLLEQVDALSVPVLILQGANDANTPAYGAEQLAQALAEAGVDVTFHLYEGLGHSLGVADSVFTDNFAPIVEEPLADLVDWLASR